MILHSPIEITGRLLPGLKIGNDRISIEYSERPGDDSRTRYRYFIDTDDFEFTEDDIQSGNQGGSLQEGLSSLLSFLSSAAESYQYEMAGNISDNADLFPENVTEWCYQNSDEISMLACEIEETENLIEE